MDLTLHHAIVEGKTLKGCRVHLDENQWRLTVPSDPQVVVDLLINKLQTFGRSQDAAGLASLYCQLDDPDGIIGLTDGNDDMAKLDHDCDADDESFKEATFVFENPSDAVAMFNYLTELMKNLEDDVCDTSDTDSSSSSDLEEEVSELK